MTNDTPAKGVMDRETRHDLNNHLSIITTYADMLVQDLDPAGKQYKFAEAIRQSALHAIAVVQGQQPSDESATTDLENYRNEDSLRRHVIVVDDQPDMRAAIQVVLELGGYDVTGCADAGELFDTLAGEGMYDVVVLDETMPGRPGHDIAVILARDYPDMPVVLLTGHARASVSPLVSDLPTVRDVIEKTDMLTGLVPRLDALF